MKQRMWQGFLAVTLAAVVAGPLWGQTLNQDLQKLVQTPAVTGYEWHLSSVLRQDMAKWKPQEDELGDVIVAIGSGAPRRLLVTPIDEPGYVVSDITPDGYLRVQRLPQFGASPVFDELSSAEPVTIFTASGRAVTGVIAGPSIHLEEGGVPVHHVLTPEQVYVDIGAHSAAEARSTGVDLLDPIALDRHLYELGTGKMTAMAVGDRFGAAALLEMLRHIDPSKIHGTLIVAFVTQEWSGGHGLERVMDRFHPDQMIYVGPALPGRGPSAAGEAPTKQPGAGVLVVGTSPQAPLTGLGAELQQLASAHGIPLATDHSASPQPPGYLPKPALPASFAHLAIATAWPSTPAALIDSGDLAHLAELLELYLQGSFTAPVMQALAPPRIELPARPKTAPPVPTILKDLVESYGISSREGPVRDAIKQLLPPWAKTETDSAGNLILRWTPAPGEKGPSMVFDAHMDEIGFQVKSIDDNGRLEVQWEGGGFLEYYLGHPLLVLTSQGPRQGILELPNGWQKNGLSLRFERGATYRVDVGARTADEARQMGVKVGDMMTIPKTYRKLLGTIATCRSFDDRVGDTALIAAAWALGPNFHGNVTFVFTTEEELGLDGAAAFAGELAKEDRVPQYVFAIDTFVSADSPLESKRFGDALVGHGFVVRAVDNSNIVPTRDVQEMVHLAEANKIPIQYGVTGGGNDGAAYLRYGSVDVALGWPLRYSHSPGEISDTRDVEGLAKIVVAAAHSWK
ncbi:MAG: M20/M25/M40 family metallo-hydrolase [Acidobacteriota bacterium]|nr:M20/M25/M40 family metallo-hydrolase [Acidobacteriota bacterium]